jgi:hypothetical protein
LKQKLAASLPRPSISAPFCKGGFSLHAAHPHPSFNERTTRKKNKKELLWILSVNFSDVRILLQSIQLP